MNIKKIKNYQIIFLNAILESGKYQTMDPVSLDQELDQSEKKGSSIYVKPRDDYLITVNCSGEKIQVYKSVLLRAPYFHNLLDGPFCDPKNATEIILDMNPKWFHMCLDRMRYGNIAFNLPTNDRYPALRYAAESLGLNFLTEEQEADRKKFKEELKVMREYGPISMEIAKRLRRGDGCRIYSRDRLGFSNRECKFSWKDVDFSLYSKMSARFRFENGDDNLTWKEITAGQLRIPDEEKLQEILARSVINIVQSKST